MKLQQGIILGLPLLASTAVVGAALALGQPGSAPAHSQDTTPPKASQPAPPDRGQQVFEQNCARCHNAPHGFSSGISNTVALHMRVRARLSSADYKALLHFLNP